MGCHQHAYYMAWLLYLVLVGLVIFLAMLGGLQLVGAMDWLKREMDSVAFLCYFLLFTSMFTFSLCLTVFFSRVATAGKVTIFFEMVLANLYWALLNPSIAQSTAANLAMCAFPISCYNMSFMDLLGIKTAFSRGTIAGLQLGLTLLYLVLYVYLDQVMPN
jgi:hypothetical protein